MPANDLTDAYPEQAAERDRWILARRDARGRLDPLKPHAFLVEEERAESGEIVAVATIFLTNRECPWRCLMCDLWKNTLLETVPLGAIPAQIHFALAQLAKQQGVAFQHGANLDTTTKPEVDSLSPRRRSGERVRERRFQRGATIGWNEPLSPALSPLVPRREREKETSSTAGLSSCAFQASHSRRLADLSSRSGQGNRPDSRARMAPLRQIKLYNSGSFFDPRAILPEDYPAIAERVRKFERVIVECHPALVGQSVLRFRDLLLEKALRNARSAAPLPALFPSPQEPRSPKTCLGDRGPKLEVAMGLETAHPEILGKLNKRMTLDQFRSAAEFLRMHEIALRVFILIKPPFLAESEALHWAKRSMDFAFDCGATALSLIPTRSGNGALEALAERGEFSQPKLSTLEAALDYGIGLSRGRVFADLWDLERFSDCSACFEPRRARLYGMNLGQAHRPVVDCEACQGRQAGAAGRVPRK